MTYSAVYKQVGWPTLHVVYTDDARLSLSPATETSRSARRMSPLSRTRTVYA